MLNRLVFTSPGAHELEQMQLILETIPVIREEDKDELLKVMPSFVSSTWEVKRPLCKLLPEVNSEGTRARQPSQHLWFHLGGWGRQSLPKGPNRVPRHRSWGPLAAGICPCYFQTEFGHRATLKAVTAGPPYSTPGFASFSFFLTCLPPSLPPPFIFSLWKAWYGFISFKARPRLSSQFHQ